VLRRGLASRRRRGGSSGHCVGTRRCTPKANGAVERFSQTLKYEHLYQREIANAAELAEEVKAFLVTFNEVRPHETLGQRPPLASYREDPYLFRGLSLQEP